MNDNRLTGDVSGAAAQIGAVYGQVTVGGGRSGRLPYRSSSVPPVVKDFQPRSVPELESLVSGGVVLSGLGGVGKTQTAAEYARRPWSVDLVGWVTASTRTSVVSGLADLGRVVSDAGDDEDAYRQFLNWCTTHSWLVVFDDVADPGELTGLLPQGPDGRLVVTTRRNEPWALAADSSELAQVGVFTAAESHAYLRGVLGEVEGIAELAALLGHLPLAISQAAAYVKRTPGMDCRKYVAKWSRSSLKRMFPGEWVGVDGRRDTVVTTWGISIEAADLLEPVGLARPMLTVMSLLDPNGIPLPVLTSGPVLSYLSSGSGGEVDGDDAAEALANLGRLNLISFDADQVFVHALVQKVTRDQLPSDRLSVLSHVAADALLNCWPPVERDTALAAMLRFNTGVLAGHANTHLWHPDGHSVLFRAGSSLGRAGQVHAAVTYHQELHAGANQHLGPDHLDTLTARNNLASWLGETGNATAAADAFTELLADQIRILGPDHP
ncbi:tetratricopeptide repeat protein, partial [Actinokineospora diospyrosa]